MDYLTLGSYAGAGHLLSGINVTGTVSGFGRFLDLDQGLARTTWTQGGTTFLRYVLTSISHVVCSKIP